MRGIAAVLLVAGCSSIDQSKDVRIAHVAALEQAIATIARGDDGQLHATLSFPGGAYSKTCTVLAADIHATWGDTAVATFKRGGTGPEGADRCDLPDLTLPALDPGTFGGLDTPVELAIYDGSGELHMIAVGPLAPRALVPDGGRLVDGTTAVVRWSSTTDYWLSVNNKDGGEGIAFECDDPTTKYGDPVFLATTVDLPYVIPLHVNGDVFSFDAHAERTYTGTMPCKLSAIAYAQITQCDFAGCEEVIALPTDNLDFYTFTLVR